VVVAKRVQEWAVKPRRPDRSIAQPNRGFAVYHQPLALLRAPATAREPQLLARSALSVEREERYWQDAGDASSGLRWRHG
jgi:hypothetical protein